MQIKYDLQCNIASALNIIGDRWTLLIVHEILIGNTTFNGIKKALNGISANLLSNRLKRLEKESLVKFEIYSKHPLRQHYLLTEKGEDLKNVLNALIIWGRKNLKDCYKVLVDAQTKEEVEIGYFITSTKKQTFDLEAIPIHQLHK